MTEQEEWTNTRLVVVDVEGNGGHPPEIVELAIVSIRRGQIEKHHSHWLLRPVQPISADVTRLHGITNEMVANAPAFGEVAADMQAALGDDYVIAHNAGVELNILIPRLTTWRPAGVIDTLELARKCLPGLRSYSLTALREVLEIPKPTGIVGPHRALYDCLVTAQLFGHLSHEPSGKPRPMSMLASTVSDVLHRFATQGKLF